MYKPLKIYREFLENAGPRMKEYVLRKAESDPGITLLEFFNLVRQAYPDDAP